MNQVHRHPLNPAAKIFGRLIQIGEKVEKGDVYDSPTGEWEPMPERLIGRVIAENQGAIFIRPVAPPDKMAA